MGVDQHFDCLPGSHLTDVSGSHVGFINAISGQCSDGKVSRSYGKSEGQAFTSTCRNGFKRVNNIKDQSRMVGGIFGCADTEHNLSVVGNGFGVDTFQQCPIGQIANGYTVTTNSYDPKYIKQFALKCGPVSDMIGSNVDGPRDTPAQFHSEPRIQTQPGLSARTTDEHIPIGDDTDFDLRHDNFASQGRSMDIHEEVINNIPSATDHICNMINSNREFVIGTAALIFLLSKRK